MQLVTTEEISRESVIANLGSCLMDVIDHYREICYRIPGERVSREELEKELRTHTESMQEVIDGEKLKRMQAYAQWLVHGVFTLTWFVSIFTDIIGLIQASQLSWFQSVYLAALLSKTIFVIATYLIFRLGYYRASKVEESIELSVYWLSAGVFLIIYSLLLVNITSIINWEFLPTGLVYTIGNFVLDFLLMYAIVYLCGTFYLDFLKRKTSLLVKEDYQKFGEVIGNIVTSLVRYAELITIYIIPFVYLAFTTGYFLMQNPDTAAYGLSTMIILVVFSISLYAALVARKSGVSYRLKFRWKTYSLDFSLIEYIVLIKNWLSELGIEEYEVFYDEHACNEFTDIKKIGLTPQEMIGTATFYPVDHKPVTLIHRVWDALNFQFEFKQGTETIDAMMKILSETWIAGRWSPLDTGLITWAQPPFFFKGERLLIDDAVLNQDTIYWVTGEPCLGFVMKAENLKKLLPSPTIARIIPQ
ncbi:MAG: hypothetical protein P1Q69_05795 [Candidatus Thorarchaeota archaeon]|nr:hypothetical protein [Candidatus Thorarchaeota archaeon]